MKEADVEIVLQMARVKFPAAKPRSITDNGKQFVAKDFRALIRLSGMSHVRTNPYYPRSNRKIERWHKTIQQDCIRPSLLLSKEDAQRAVDRVIEKYNFERLHSAIGYVTPHDRLIGNHTEIHRQRDLKLDVARRMRAQKEETETIVRN